MSDTSPITLLFTGAPAIADVFTPGIATTALVRLNGRTLLFGSGPYAYRPILLIRLKRLGIDPGEIDTVILSHVHWDAASNADIFTNAEVILHERELAYADDVARHDDQTAGYIGRVLRRLKLRTISGETELAPGLRILDLPGHTPGSIGLLVCDELLAGDAVTCARDAASMRASATPHDQAMADESLTKAIAAGRIIYPGHDRPFRIENGRVVHAADYNLRIRLFLDPYRPDGEIQISSSAPKSFASWP